MTDQLGMRIVATVRPDASLAQAAQLLIEHHVSGLPVVDQDGRLIGLVTEHDFLRQHDGTRRRWLDALLAKPGGQITARELYDRRVANVMSRGPISVRVDTPIEEIVDLMHRHRIKRLPVVADDKVVGIVSPSGFGGSTARPGRTQATKLASFNFLHGSTRPFFHPRCGPGPSLEMLFFQKGPDC